MDLNTAGPPQPIHPYYPQTAHISCYRENETPLVFLLAAFGLLLAAVALGSAKLASKHNSNLTTVDKFVVAWYSICSFLHVFFEGYFIRHHATLAGKQTLFGQLWKEYSLSDSRYLTSDPFMLAVETITVFIWGPLCFSAALCIARESIIRHPIQVMVCVAHLYGVLLYYGTCFADSHFRGISHSRPEFLYFWVYYVGFNIPWVIVPILLLVRSIRATRLAFGTLMAVQGLLCGVRFKVERFEEARTKPSDDAISSSGSDSDAYGNCDGGGGGYRNRRVDVGRDDDSGSRSSGTSHGYVDVHPDVYGDSSSDRDSGIGSS